jgi:hypothetical protein
MDPVTMMALGAVAGGGMSLLGGNAEDDARDLARRRQSGLENQFSSFFKNDPLLERLLGGLANPKMGRPFDIGEVTEAGQQQLGYLRQRKQFDALRALARGGFDPGGAQMTAMDRQLNNQQNLADQQMRTNVQAMYSQQLPQAQQAAMQSFLGALAPTMQLGAQAGALNKPGSGGGYANEMGQQVPTNPYRTNSNDAILQKMA